MCSLHNDFSFSRAVVTGASEGIGRGYALEVHMLYYYRWMKLDHYIIHIIIEIAASQTRSECGDNEQLSRESTGSGRWNSWVQYQILLFTCSIELVPALLGCVCACTTIEIPWAKMQHFWGSYATLWCMFMYHKLTEADPTRLKKSDVRRSMIMQKSDHSYQHTLISIHFFSSAHFYN